MNYTNTSIETIAELLLCALLGLRRAVCVTSEVEDVAVCSLPMSELLEAGIGFCLLDAIDDDAHTRVLVRKEALVDNSTIDAYFTTSGDDPVTVPEATQADLVRSAGGWSDAQPDPEDVEIGDVRPAETWADFRLYLARRKEQRHDTFVAMFDWMRAQRSASQLRAGFAKFRRRNAANVAECRKANDWTKLKLSKSQVERLQRYYRIRLSVMP